MIVVNGKSYASLDEMPPEIRQSYEQALGMLADNNQNGIPDVFEGMLSTGNVNVQTSTVVGPTQFIVGGKVYSNVDELPPDARQKYEQAMTKMGAALGSLMSDANQNGRSDIINGTISIQSTSSTTTTTPATTPSGPLFDATPTDIASPQPNYRRMVIFAGVVIVVLLIVLLALVASIVVPRFG